MDCHTITASFQSIKSILGSYLKEKRETFYKNVLIKVAVQISHLLGMFVDA